MVALPKFIPISTEAIVPERAIHCLTGVSMNRPSILDWYCIFRVHYHVVVFQVIRYALWLTR